MTNANMYMGVVTVLVILLAFYGQVLANDKYSDLVLITDNLNSQLETCQLQ